MSLLAGAATIGLAPTPTDRSFDPEATRAMGVAFLSACWALGPAGKSNEVKTRVALVIVDLAAQGERDPARLRTGALRSIVG